MTILSSSSKQGADSVVPASYVYSKNGTVQHTVTTGYSADGRIATAGFLHGGAEKQFGYGYLPGSNLLQTLTMPCNMTLTQSYETQRDLLIGMAYHRGTTLVTQRTYSYDTLGRPLTRSTVRNGQTVNDSFVHNSRSELVSATVNGKDYEYAYDNIGNRTASIEDSSGVASRTEYTANELNQYTSIQENEDTSFVPAFDANGNQTLVKTSTGIWNVEYNAENRPISFSNADSGTIVECSYDYMGRRATKKVTTNGSVSLHQRYIYHGYLQIACCDLTRSGHPCLWLLTWDPTQTIATRPLAIRKDGTWYAYGWDLTKNICEVFGQHGYLRTAYTYSPFGDVTADGDVTQPFQWSSEYNDTELALVYYNYRHYNPVDGRWTGRDRIQFEDGYNPFVYCQNDSISQPDVLGNSRESREAHRINAYRQRKIGTKLNIHKSYNVEVDNMANMKPTSYIGSKMRIPTIASALDNIIQTYITLATTEVVSTMYSIIEQIPNICKNAKSQSTDSTCGETCCTIEIKAIYVKIENNKQYIKIDSYKVLHSNLPCNRTSYLNAPDKGLCDTFRVEIPMKKMDVKLD